MEEKRGSKIVDSSKNLGIERNIGGGLKREGAKESFYGIPNVNNKKVHLR